MSIWSRTYSAREAEGGGRRKERNEDNERGDEPKVGKRCLRDRCLSTTSNQTRLKIITHHVTRIVAGKVLT